MAITRKEFVLQVVEEIKQNPRAVLAGHGINAAVLQTIVGRPDVLAKLATVLYSTIYAKKGANGLKKTPLFKLAGYKSAGALIDTGREDIESFIEGLPAEDQAKFTNANNIFVVTMLPEHAPTGEETTTDEIVSGKSVAMTFDQAISKAFKFPGAMYLVVMIADSAARPAEEAIAKRKEKVNKTKQAKRTPAKIASELKAKANKKLEILESKRKSLESAAITTQKQLAQFKQIGQEFGVKGGSPASVIGAMRKFDKNAQALKAGYDAEIALLNDEQKTYLAQALKYKKMGKMNMVKAYLKELNNPVIAEYIMAEGTVKTSEDILADRKSGIKSKLKELVAKNEQLLIDLSLAPDAGKKASIRSMISKNNAAIRDLRAKLGTYKNISVKGMATKAAMLKEVHAAIEENIKLGEGINEALTNALNALNAKPAQKEIIKQQIMQQVADGKPMQFAVQQAIQDNFEAPVEGLETSELGDDLNIKNLLDSL